jgi:opacity protein-like surface antigen
MNTMLRSAVALAFVATLAAPAAAQTPVTFGVGGGLAVPMSNFKDAFKLGWDGTAMVSFAPPNVPVGFRVDGTYMQNVPKAAARINGGFDKAQTIFGTADVVFAFNADPGTMVHPYLLGGVGAYNQKYKLANGTSFSKTKLGVNAGAGLNFASSSGVGFFAEARFHNIFVSGGNVSFIPINVGIHFGGR